MSIEKKSLISTLKTTKKANAVSSTPSAEAAHKMTKTLAKRPTKTLAKRPTKTLAKRPTKTLAKIVRA